jgi:hypothetical protein
MSAIVNEDLWDKLRKISAIPFQAGVGYLNGPAHLKNTCLDQIISQKNGRQTQQQRELTAPRVPKAFATAGLFITNGGNETCYIFKPYMLYTIFHGTRKYPRFRTNGTGKRVNG